MNPFANFSLLYRNRNFSLLYVGQFISFIGAMITAVALPYQIYQETHSTLMVGLLSFFQLMPLLITALLGGVLADRKHRQKLLLIAEALLAVGCLILALNAAQAKPSILLIFVTAMGSAALVGIHRPAFDSITQQLVSKQDFSAVASLSTFKFSACMIAGPALGGLIIAQFGLVVTFLIDFATFVISITTLLLMRDIPKPKVVEDISTWASLKQGVKYALSRQELVGTYLVDFIAMIFGMPMALFPAIAETYGGVKVLGMLYAAPAVGALVISFFSGWTKHITRHGIAIAVSAVLWGICIIFFGLAGNLYIALFFLALSGTFDAVSGMFRSIMWNETIPNELRGRLSGIEMISYLSGPKLGDTEAGLIAAAFGVTASIVSGGILCVAGVIACCYFLPKFCRYRSEQVEQNTIQAESE